MNVHELIKFLTELLLTIYTGIIACKTLNFALPVFPGLGKRKGNKADFRCLMLYILSETVQRFSSGMVLRVEVLVQGAAFCLAFWWCLGHCLVNACSCAFPLYVFGIFEL